MTGPAWLERRAEPAPDPRQPRRTNSPAISRSRAWTCPIVLAGHPSAASAASIMPHAAHRVKESGSSKSAPPRPIQPLREGRRGAEHRPLRRALHTHPASLPPTGSPETFSDRAIPSPRRTRCARRHLKESGPIPANADGAEAACPTFQSRVLVHGNAEWDQVTTRTGGWKRLGSVPAALARTIGPPRAHRRDQRPSDRPSTIQTGVLAVIHELMSSLGLRRHGGDEPSAHR